MASETRDWTDLWDRLVDAADAPDPEYVVNEFARQVAERECANLRAQLEAAQGALRQEEEAGGVLARDNRRLRARLAAARDLLDAFVAEYVREFYGDINAEQGARMLQTECADGDLFAPYADPHLCALAEVLGG